MTKTTIEEMKLGNTYNNTEVSKAFNIAIQGGMRKSKLNNCLVLFSAEAGDLYSDSWDGDILNFSGQGSGDQDINYGQNKTLARSRESGITLYLFINIAANKNVYYGEVRLEDDPYTINDGQRNAIIFPLEFLGNKDKLHECNKRVGYSAEHEQRKRAQKLSTSKLIKQVRQHQTGEKKVSWRPVTEKAYLRNQGLVKLAREFAKGKCQLCEYPAPFNDKEGEPFLEVHHIKWLSKGGSDSIDNVIALCPNCHRRMHQIADPDDVRKLQDKANGNLCKIKEQIE